MDSNQNLKLNFYGLVCHTQFQPVVVLKASYEPPLVRVPKIFIDVLETFLLASCKYAQNRAKRTELSVRFQNLCKSYEDDMNATRDKISSLNKTLETSAETIQQLCEDLSTSNQAVAELSYKLSQQSVDYEKLKADMAKKESYISQLENNISKLHKNFGKTKEKID